MRSSLAKLQTTTPLNQDELMKKKKEAWQDRVALVVTFEQMAALGNKEHETCMNIGNKLYGKK